MLEIVAPFLYESNTSYNSSTHMLHRDPVEIENIGSFYIFVFHFFMREIWPKSLMLSY